MNLKKIVFWVLVAGVFLGGAGYFAWTRVMAFSPVEIEQTQILLAGNQISADKAAELEAKVRDNPDDLDDRLTLLGYYSTRQFGSPDIQKARDAHVLWLIQNHPDAQPVVMSFAEIINPSNPDYEQAKQLWLDQLQKNPQNIQILKNAASFFNLPDKPMAESLLLKGAALEPSSSYWPNHLGHLYRLEKDPVKAFGEMEQAYNLASNGIEKMSILSDLAKIAVEAGELEKAQKYAQALLDGAQGSITDFRKYEDLHDANMVLGRVALRNGDLEGAKQYLLKAGQAPGSHPCSAFGPNMSLAKDLLEKGESATVLQYFDLCANFWNNKAQLSQWASQVNAGQMPDFRGNLLY